LCYGEGSLGLEPQDLSTVVYGDSDDGSFRAYLAFDDESAADSAVVRIRVNTDQHKFGSGATLVTDAGPLTKELCLRHHGRELSPHPEGGWSFLVNVPGAKAPSASSLRSHRRKLWRGMKSLGVWLLALGPAVPIAGSVGIWSGIRRQLPQRGQLG
jgi:hypothetical protein